MLSFAVFSNKRSCYMKKSLMLSIVLSTVLSLSLTQAYAANTSASQANEQAGTTFMKKNAENPKVVTLPSGLQYEILEDGTGPTPSKTDKVTVDYEGKLVDGTVFDSSYSRGQSASFPVNGVIAGWQEALPLMKTGSTWMLYIPPSLAYGATGAGPIGPNETLVFKVHLISIDK